MSFLTKTKDETIIPAEPYDGQKWEYRTLNLSFKAGPDFEKAFNELGQQGWEFVNTVMRSGKGVVTHAVFKRPL